MSEDISYGGLQPAGFGAPVPGRRSGRKRTIVESYEEDMKSSQPLRKRIKDSPVEVSSDAFATKKMPAGTKLKADSTLSKAKVKADPKLSNVEVVDLTADDSVEQPVATKGKAKAKEEASGKATGKAAKKDEEKRLKR